MELEFCPKSEDKQHCIHWYDGEPCCRCGTAMNFGDAIQALKNALIRTARWGCHTST